MALGRRRSTPEPHPVPPRSLVASAARIRKLDGQGWQTYKFGDESWQQEAWRLYDIIGELHFVANWIGSALSRVRIYVAEVDKNGRVQKETEKPKVAALADTLFGGPNDKSELIRLMGVNLTVVGDAYIVGKSIDHKDKDEWFVLSGSELRRYTQTGTVEYTNYFGEPEFLDPAKDLIIRVWTPHARRTMWADSPTRAAMPMLWEIERLTRYVFAQIDSRLISAGMFPIPAETSFPDETDEDGNLLSASEAMTSRLLKAGASSLQNEGTAAGVVPLFFEVPMEALGKLANIEIGSSLSAQALELRSEAVRRFALAMDIDPSILAGAAEGNHWQVWHVNEGQIKIHIEPVMTRICQAVTQAYLRNALKHIKEDPDKYTFWYDTAPLTVRPERLKETQELYRDNIVSREAVLLSGNYKISDLPSEEEDTLRFTRELMLRDPNLFYIPAVRRVAGYSDEILPPGEVTPPPESGGAGPAPPPAPLTSISPTTGGPMPVETQAANAPGGPPTPASITAAIDDDPNAFAVANANTFVVANAAVVRALELAGKRLLDRHQRGTWPDTPPYDLHTRIKVQGADHATKLLAGAWDHLSVLAEHLDPEMDTLSLETTLQDYCMALLDQSQPHRSALLAKVLDRKGFLRAQS